MTVFGFGDCSETRRSDRLSTFGAPTVRARLDSFDRSLSTVHVGSNALDQSASVVAIFLECAVVALQTDPVGFEFTQPDLGSSDVLAQGLLVTIDKACADFGIGR